MWLVAVNPQVDINTLCLSGFSLLDVTVGLFHWWVIRASLTLSLARVMRPQDEERAHGPVVGCVYGLP